MVKEILKTIEIISPKSIDLLEKNPEIIVKSLSPLEGQIIKTLFWSLTGLSARDIQRQIIIENLNGFLIEHKLTGISYDTTLSVLDLMKKAQNNKVNFPSHSTIIKNLENLVEMGYSGRRMLPENRKVSFIYFLNPELYSLLKKAHLEGVRK